MPQIKTGDITYRIGLIVTANLIESLGFPPDQSDGRSKLWDASKYPAICDALGDYIKSRRNATDMAPNKPRTKAAGAPFDDPDEL